MDELYAYLFAGLFIIFLLFIFFGGAEVGVDYRGEWGPGKEDPSIEQGISWKEIDLGDIISEERTVQSSQLLDSGFYVQNGVFFGSTGYERIFWLDSKMAESLKNASLNFKIDETNSYGSLVMGIGNSTFFDSRSLRGEYQVSLPPLEQKNILKVYTSSSGWRLWAPSRYQISNLTLDVSYTTKETPYYEFDVPHYIYGSFYRGEISFNSIRPADLLVYINGHEAYNQRDVLGRVNIPLDRRQVFPERNTIEIVSRDNYRLEETKIYLYYRN
jgi:hypothetical protein